MAKEKKEKPKSREENVTGKVPAEVVDKDSREYHYKHRNDK